MIKAGAGHDGNTNLFDKVARKGNVVAVKADSVEIAEHVVGAFGHKRRESGARQDVTHARAPHPIVGQLLGEKAVRQGPITEDAIMGDDLLWALAEIYVRCGENSAAMDQLELLCSVAPAYSPALLSLDPIWDPVRDHPRFQALLAGES